MGSRALFSLKCRPYLPTCGWKYWRFHLSELWEVTAQNPYPYIWSLWLCGLTSGVQGSKIFELSSVLFSDLIFVVQKLNYIHVYTYTGSFISVFSQLFLAASTVLTAFQSSRSARLARSHKTSENTLHIAENEDFLSFVAVNAFCCQSCLRRKMSFGRKDYTRRRYRWAFSFW